MNATLNTRQQAQLAFVASGAELEIGRPEDCPLPPSILAVTDGREAYVSRELSGGLTAHVYRIEAQGQSWTLKRARERCLVQNADGQTSFLNEVQRRADLQALKARPELAERLGGIVDTCYASFRRGVLLSPWIEGEQVAEWDETRLGDLFDTVITLASHGLFEWDLCPGNVLDDGRIRLFDFGYMYRFDPLREFNSDGLAAPGFHPVERFETRQFFAWLLEQEQAGGNRALAAFRLEKSIALDRYLRWHAELKRQGADTVVLDRIGEIIRTWQTALVGSAEALYLREAWRSHRLDLADDLDGQTCTPLTLQRLAWLRDTAAARYFDLVACGALAIERAEGRNELLDQLDRAEAQAIGWQVPRA
ncbi:hypothetical protein NA645_00230 [Pseudomonas stutzeri]|uniref:hypothetical protein n=1 Tax=Stutzerimonas stutzeri TaxID=316 RepID=UPI00210DF3DA|nr:hypothetical protein [Stutzerimonas stutzeri]MCQ4306411.1 hypothetical protein [Stutzerimonas stutzeri]